MTPPTEPGPTSAETVRIFHLTTADQWAAAATAGELRPAGFAEEGFVHCSTLEQLTGTIERHFAGVDELLVLELDPGALAADLRWEESHPGEVFPHLYRPLRAGDVTAEHPWRRSPAGSVALPPTLV